MMRVIDFHVHLPTGGPAYWIRPLEEYAKDRGEHRLRIIRRWVVQEQESLRKTWGFPEPEKGPASVEEASDRWAGEVRSHGLERVVFMSGRYNDKVSVAVQRHPELFTGFACHNPFGDGAPVELERAVDVLGLCGYKVIDPSQSIICVVCVFLPVIARNRGTEQLGRGGLPPRRISGMAHALSAAHTVSSRQTA